MRSPKASEKSVRTNRWQFWRIATATGAMAPRSIAQITVLLSEVINEEIWFHEYHFAKKRNSQAYENSFVCSIRLVELDTSRNLIQWCRNNPKPGNVILVTTGPQCNGHHAYTGMPTSSWAVIAYCNLCDVRWCWRLWNKVSQWRLSLRIKELTVTLNLSWLCFFLFQESINGVVLRVESVNGEAIADRMAVTEMLAASL